MNKKVLLVLMLAVIITITGCGKKENNNDNTSENVNTNTGVVEKKEVDVFTFVNTSLTWNGNASNLVTVITNTSEEEQYLKGFRIHVYDEDGNEIASMTGYVGSKLKANESRQLSTGHYENLTNAAKVEYEVLR
jgi:uncharacterized lipoprotein NlpE involved in copper resistance